MNDQLLKQLGVEQQILQQMVDERAALAEADRLKIRVSDEEVRQRIFAIPAFQENGQFIGEQRYNQLLRAQRPPLTGAEFEDNVRRQLTVEKLRASLTDWISVPDQELEQEYRRRNDKVKLAVVSLTADSFRAQVTASDAEVSSYFDAHKADFKIGEKRKIRYLLIDQDALKAKTVVPPADIERAYNSNIEQYSTPEQVRASHILLKTEGKDDAAVKAQGGRPAEAGEGRRRLRGAGQEVLGRRGEREERRRPRLLRPRPDGPGVRPGRLHDGSRDRSATSVKTSFGYHIIKLVDKKPGTTRPLAEVQPAITDQLATERAQAQAADLAQTLAKDISQAGRPRQGRQGARHDGAGVRRSSRATSRPSRSARRPKRPRACSR